ncbi:ribosome recycling factor [Buchnera aphidicola]|uniref:Ribosome-recycling factor n=1 Tax=Buchnera aphidicola subsp. Acyrthosiphon pisum (strain Tuc7) TaxID=561501 RepID=RRF_BUCAT|nr:ribosome recycling factor [Buchnera aphidicola]B8D7D5.1 RecName: Full=Ribosome-recycling factor; Short=RRF; AltName: Full=Ribosome-releasing factor [Buchnera aphidicola str. Tuc7 (Acyrthosiphon pisum)]ACL30050.1 ribosome recycling factor [Buchnera aphidicola str. Tuc7 (Acyrthosiphon pisum)]ADP66057.1 ribosome recycling factor [Buchnera aphidicola str. LL01 (Acyrthosiphon pisum)]ADP66630.1 ribosome recycling factor [Buchnera aphidicola str. TLW03 (Acyrthosiphon pisum)]
MINQIDIKTRERMEACIQTFHNNINNIKTGRASPTLLHNIYIEYFGSKTPLRQVSNIIVEDSHTLKINVFDDSITSLIRKSILNSNLDLNPVLQGKDIIIPIPRLTEERRKQLIKVIRGDAESSRIQIRNIRRDANDKVKRLLKDKIISEDNEHTSQSKIQIMTNEYIKKIDCILEKKEKELMKF